jgi:hypothetical protein
MKGALKRITWIYIRFVQKILINIFLTLTYFFVIPFNWLYLIIFRRKQITRKFSQNQTYWQKVPEHKNQIEEYLTQS